MCAFWYCCSYLLFLVFRFWSGHLVCQFLLPGYASYWFNVRFLPLIFTCINVVWSLIRGFIIIILPHIQPVMTRLDTPALFSSLFSWEDASLGKQIIFKIVRDDWRFIRSFVKLTPVRVHSKLMGLCSVYGMLSSLFQILQSLLPSGCNLMHVYRFPDPQGNWL